MTDEHEPQPELIRKRLRRATRPPAKAEAPSPAKIMAMIRFLAEETDRVIFGDHAQARMDERGIHDADVYEVLRLGEISGRVLPGKNPGEWKAKVVAKPRGSRLLGVVTIVLTNEQYLFVKTTEWEDR